MPAVVNAAAAPTRRRRRTLLLVLDGMRPASIDARLTPNLARLAASGVTFERSRTGFPSETMVGAGELFAGAYPERSGVTGNWMPVPGSTPGGTELKSLDGIRAMAKGFGGAALTTTSLFQAVAGAGRTSAVIGKEGPAELASVAGATWAVSSGGVHEDERARAIGAARGARPLDQIVSVAAGTAPKSGDRDDRARSDWLVRVAAAVDAQLAPDLLTVWLTDPDKTQHGHGLGSGNQRDALRAADAAVGALLDDLRRRGQLDDVDIVVTSDHGFSEHLPAPEIDLLGVLRGAGLKVSHVTAAGNQHLVRFAAQPTARELAQLRRAIARSPIAPLVRTIIDSPRTERGGTHRDTRLTGSDLRLGTTRAADVYVVYQRDDRGVRGTRRRGGRGPAHIPAKAGTTVAGHGSMGWTDLNNTLVLAGPGVDRARPGAPALRTRNAAGIIDVAPTILHLLGIPAPSGMQGRALLEALVPDGHVPDGHVAARASQLLVAATRTRLGDRSITTRLTTELLGSQEYFVGLDTSG